MSVNSEGAVRRTRLESLSGSRLLFLIHSATGLWLTILLSIVLLSGTLTVFWQEIDWLAYSELRVERKEQRLNPGLLFDKIVATHSKLAVEDFETNIYDPRSAASARVVLPNGTGVRQIWIDPYTGVIQGDTPFLTVGKFIELLHTSLYLPVIGRAFVNFFGLLAVISTITGLLTYKKFWRGFFRRPRFDRNARTWIGDLHRLTALWSLWFLIVIAVTGSWWFYLNPLVKYKVIPTVVSSPPKVPELTEAELARLGPETPERLSAEAIVKVVKSTYPDLAVTRMRPPGNATQPYIIMGDRKEILTRIYANTIYVNPYSGAILGRDIAENWPAMRRVSAAMHPLHYGTWIKTGSGNFIVKSVWFVGGLAMSFLALSGLFIYLRRTRDALAGALASRRIVHLLKKIWNTLKPWGGPMGVMKYINYAGSAAIIAGAFLIISLASRGVEGKGRDFPEQAAGPFKIELTALAGLLEADLPPIRPGARTEIYVRIADGKFKDARIIRIGAHATGEAKAQGSLTRGPNGIAVANVRLPKDLADAYLWAEIEGWDGQVYRTEWPVRAE
ncbi:MAG: PepSY domain-containing protein [Hyphomicrobiaceae bacterium]|nr:PepSY domain-containing protein [Hyphomicrobiaceae bacterium]